LNRSGVCKSTRLAAAPLTWDDELILVRFWARKTGAFWGRAPAGYRDLQDVRDADLMLKLERGCCPECGAPRMEYFFEDVRNGELWQRFGWPSSAPAYLT